MQNDNSAHLAAPNGRVALTRASIDIDWSGLIAIGRLTQHYRNSEAHAIEAVYTFPLGWKAVLLDVEVRLGERTLAVRIVEKSVAARDYETATASGDSAVLIEMVRPGVYSMNLGNLLPGETAAVSLKWAEFTLWQGEVAMLRIPTTFAPRYGDPAAGGFAPHQVPQHDPLVEYPLEIAVNVSGPAANGRLSSPTHTLATQAQDGAVRVSLAGNAFLDRDFVLNCAAQWAEGYCMRATDAASAESLAVTLFPPSRPLPAPGVRDIRFLVDCSGSMNGDSIAQARRALVELLVSLRDDEWFNVTAFGSSTRTLFEKPQPATPSAKRHALEFAERLQADLGGTEMAAALREIALAAPAGGAAIVLITDGEVHDIADVAVRLEERKLRVFGIGVGAAPAEDVVRTLAETTGGDHCFVTPNDDMSAAVLRHLAALRALRMVSSRVDWASPAPRWQWPAGNGPRSGADPIIDAAAFTTAQERQPRLRCRFVDETTTTYQAHALAVTPAWCADNALPRLIAGLRVRELPEAAAIALAVRHQVICAHTSAIMVRQRAEDEKGDTVPELRVVPHMLAAGWGGAGTVMRSAHLPSHPAMFESSAPADYTSIAGAPPTFLMAGPRMACASADPALTALPHILIEFLRSTARYCEAGQAPVPEQWDDLDSMLPTDLIPLLAWLQRAGGYPADDMRSPLILLYQALLRMPDARTRLLEAFEPMQRLVAGAAAPDGDVVAALLEFLATGRRPKTERQTL